MTIQELQDKTDGWIKKYGVRYFNELTNLALLMEEVGELARIIARQYGEQSFKNEESKMQLSEELADVLYWVLLMGSDMNIDVISALESKMDKNEAKYPIEKAKGKHTKYNKL